MDDNLNQAGSSTTTAGNTADQTVVTPPVTDANEDLDIDFFRDQLLEDLGATNLPKIEKEKLMIKIEKLVFDRIISIVMIYLDQAKAPELEKIIDEGDSKKITDFIQQNIPGLNDKIFDELARLRNELIDRSKKYQGV
ncbi:MAG: hypothetical protein WCG48_00820 [Candidatus Berkelbacteria bacterium]